MCNGKFDCESPRYERLPYSGPLWVMVEGEISPLLGWSIKVCRDDGSEISFHPISYWNGPNEDSHVSALGDEFSLYLTREEAEKAQLAL